MHSRSFVAWLRFAQGRGPDPEVTELLERLLVESAEFAELWKRHEVARWLFPRKVFVHPLIGDITLDCQILTGENLTERLVVLSATPGSEDAEKLKLLAVVGSQSFAPGA